MPTSNDNNNQSKTKRQKYYINTIEFCKIWAKQNDAEKKLADKDKHTSWRAFVLAVVDAMGARNTSYVYPAHMDMSVEQVRYNFGSERCYNKAKAIQTKLMKENGKTPALPDGWATRRGPSTDGRSIDWEEIGGLFD